jgi:polysaccharide biosynthesis/export protein
MTNNKNKAILLYSIVLVSLMTSCVSQRNLEYIQDKDISIKAFKEATIEDYKLRPNDELYIQISSLDEAAANVFSTTSAQSSMSIGGMAPYGASLAAYAINKEGYLLLPLIGSIYVKDKTTSQVSAILKDSLTSILNQPIVSVKLVNRYVTILGEVKTAGHFPYSQEKLTIFDALGLAGDITLIGDRTQVVLVRNEDGKNLRINLNLSNSDIIASEYYYLRPNDLVYVKPLKNKLMKVRDPIVPPLYSTISMFLSTISTALLIYTVVNK